MARLALGPAAPVSGTAGAPTVEERLLAGELPVRPEDLPFLASRLGVASDPRVAALEARLRRAPDAADLPPAPSFRRRLRPGGPDRGLERGRPVAAPLRAAGREPPRARGPLGPRVGLAGGRRHGRGVRALPHGPGPGRGGALPPGGPSSAGRPSPGRPAGRALALGRGGCRRPPGPASRPRPGGAGGRPRARLPGRRHPRAAHAAHHDTGAGRDARRGPGRAARVRLARGPGERAARGARGARPHPDPRRAGPAVRPRRSRRAPALGGGARDAARGTKGHADRVPRGAPSPGVPLGRRGGPPGPPQPARQRRHPRPRGRPRRGGGGERAATR